MKLRQAKKIRSRITWTDTGPYTMEQCRAASRRYHKSKSTFMRRCHEMAATLSSVADVRGLDTSMREYSVTYTVVGIPDPGMLDVITPPLGRIRVSLRGMSFVPRLRV